MAKSETKNLGFRGLIIVILSFIMVPILALVILYFSSDGFRYNANQYLSSMPGRIGNYFSSQPTREEMEALKNQIARHYISFEEDRLTDRLLIIRSKDRKLFNDLVVILNNLNPRKMRIVGERIRQSDLTDNLLQLLIEEVESEEIQRVDTLSNHFQSLRLSDAVLEIQRTFANGELRIEMLPALFERIPLNLAASYIYHLDEELKKTILFNLRLDKKREIERELQIKQKRLRQLEEIAMLYEEKNVEELLQLIGSDENFNTTELAHIFANLSVIKGGQTMAMMKDNELVLSILDEMLENETLGYIQEGRTKSMTIALEAYKNYFSRVDELVEVYKKLSISELAELVEEMLNSNRVFMRYQIDSINQIALSDRQLILDVLRNFNATTIARLIGQLRTQQAINMTQRLITN